MNVCARPGCGEPAQNKYCSRACANQDKNRMRKVKIAEGDISNRIEVLRSGAVPTALENVLVAGLGYEGTQEIFQEMEYQRAMGGGLQLAAVSHKLRTTAPIWPLDNYGSPETAFPRTNLKPTPPASRDIEPYAVMRKRSEGVLADFRRDDEIPWEDVERMQRSGPCMLAVRMKKAPLIAALSGRRKWSVECSDSKLAAVVGANTHTILLKNIHNMLQAMDYGVAFGSMSWKKETAEKIGVIEKGVGKQTKWYVVDRIDWAHPTTVQQILRDDDFRFAGFEHARKNRSPRLKIITPPGALVLTYNGLFGNMYGKTIYDPIYDFWFWYEVVLRSFLRYLERMGTPVAVCYAPQKGQTTRPDGTVVSNAQYALLIAGYAAQHSALYMPSDTFPDGKPMWRLEYLPADQRGEQFVKALQYLGTQIMRGVVVGDRSVTQDSEVGSYNAASIHDKNTAVDNDAIFKDLLGQLNDYWIKRYAQFNVDYNDPPLCMLKAQVLDPLEREILMKLFATAGNIKVGDGTPLDRIDWEAALQGVYAPILTDEQMEEQREKRLADSIEAQKERMKAMPQQQSGPAPFGQKGAQEKSGENGKQKQPTPDQKVRASIAQHLYGGGMVPVLVGVEDALMLARPVQDSFTVDGVKLYRDDEEEIELGLEDILKKIKDVQRQAARAGATARATQRAGAAIGSVADEEFERQHPRDERGRFAKKVVEEMKEDIGGRLDEAMRKLIGPGAFPDPALDDSRGDVRAALAKKEITQEQADALSAVVDSMDGLSWPGADKNRALKGAWKIGDREYHAVGKDIPARSVIGTLIVSMRTDNRLKAMGIETEPIHKLAVGDFRDVDAMARYYSEDLGNCGPFKANGDDIRWIMGKGGGFTMEETVLFGKGKRAIMVDDGLIRQGMDEPFEALYAHEVLHNRIRSEGRIKGGTASPSELGFLEETFNTFMENKYLDRHGLPNSFMAYDINCDQLLRAADARGMTKDELYDFVDDAHGVDGDKYPEIWKAFFEETGVSPNINLSDYGSTTQKGPLGLWDDEVIRAWYPEYDTIDETVNAMYETLNRSYVDLDMYIYVYEKSTGGKYREYDAADFWREFHERGWYGTTGGGHGLYGEDYTLQQEYERIKREEGQK